VWFVRALFVRVVVVVVLRLFAARVMTRLACAATSRLLRPRAMKSQVPVPAAAMTVPAMPSA